ncbi:hypothetical protein HPS12939_1280 [Glaesserella parasuis 12939]|uniref:Uncharacterized protein n=1 Tax=Glaesserella parasuis serovar 5 (strain SH0165) TaxID=557723 RepID=B8F6I0_GLAP5|nr:hypothetical protein HAPS_1352 [Glaesserella parasuis SH0165]EQA00813.1 hypothetical protein HPSMNH_1035 [Glaesserella parasuis MN-H]EQA05371.1 hypothetical protein HPS12939_1280 [Glaesserella parasuis 12939]EQA06725.1 hypothetical protein HPSD74_2041 [Glaesserella parasuis D74]
MEKTDRLVGFFDLHKNAFLQLIYLRIVSIVSNLIKFNV